MNALSSLKSVNKGLETVQGRIATGLKVTSAKDNAAYYQISETMKGDSAAYSSINEGLTLTKNSVATARLGAETFQDLANQFVERVAFAQGAAGGLEEIEADLGELVKQMKTTISQSTFNGDDLVNADAGYPASSVDATNGTVTKTAELTPDRTVVTGVTRSGGTFAATTTTIETQDLSAMLADLEGIATGFAAAGNTTATGQAYLQGVLVASEGVLSQATDAATSLGQSEETIEKQQSFLTKLVDNIDTGVGSMVDANMEEEAARLQAMQVQQQLATQALSIANSSPQNVLSLFR
jgi:flagellin